MARSVPFCSLEPPLGTVGPPRAAADDCECETWDRISHNLTVGVANGMFGPCRSNPSCTGTNCDGKIPDPTLGAFNLSFQVFPCRPKIFLRVHLSVPKKGVNWTRDFQESERVPVPGMSFFGHEESKTNGWIQVNITQVSAQERVLKLSAMLSAKLRYSWSPLVGHLESTTCHPKN